VHAVMASDPCAQRLTRARARLHGDDAEPARRTRAAASTQKELHICLLLLYDKLNDKLPCHLRVPRHRVQTFVER
jgi:hypothetical protein